MWDGFVDNLKILWAMIRGLFSKRVEDKVYVANEDGRDGNDERNARPLEIIAYLETDGIEPEKPLREVSEYEFMELVSKVFGLRKRASVMMHSQKTLDRLNALPGCHVLGFSGPWTLRSALIMTAAQTWIDQVSYVCALVRPDGGMQATDGRPLEKTDPLVAGRFLLFMRNDPDGLNALPDWVYEPPVPTDGAAPSRPVAPHVVEAEAA